MNVSIGTMVKTIDGLRGTKDVSSWEDEFIASVVDRTNNGANTTMLSEKQVSVVERIYNKHFGG